MRRTICTAKLNGMDLGVVNEILIQRKLFPITGNYGEPVGYDNEELLSVEITHDHPMPHKTYSGTATEVQTIARLSMFDVDIINELMTAAKEVLKTNSDMGEVGMNRRATTKQRMQVICNAANAEERLKRALNKAEGR